MSYLKKWHFVSDSSPPKSSRIYGIFISVPYGLMAWSVLPETPILTSRISKLFLLWRDFLYSHFEAGIYQMTYCTLRWLIIYTSSEICILQVIFDWSVTILNKIPVWNRHYLLVQENENKVYIFSQPVICCKTEHEYKCDRTILLKTRKWI